MCEVLHKLAAGRPFWGTSQPCNNRVHPCGDAGSLPLVQIRGQQAAQQEAHKSERVTPHPWPRSRRGPCHFLLLPCRPLMSWRPPWPAPALLHPGCPAAPRPAAGGSCIQVGTCIPELHGRRTLRRPAARPLMRLPARQTAQSPTHSPTTLPANLQLGERLAELAECGVHPLQGGRVHCGAQLRRASPRRGRPHPHARSRCQRVDLALQAGCTGAGRQSGREERTWPHYGFVSWPLFVWRSNQEQHLRTVCVLAPAQAHIAWRTANLATAPPCSSSNPRGPAPASPPHPPPSSHTHRTHPPTALPARRPPHPTAATPGQPPAPPAAPPAAAAPRATRRGSPWPAQTAPPARRSARQEAHGGRWLRKE